MDKTTSITTIKKENAASGMVCADQSTAGKRSDDPGMVQRKRDQAKHVLQPPKKSS